MAHTKTERDGNEKAVKESLTEYLIHCTHTVPKYRNIQTLKRGERERERDGEKLK
jgi:hypothetical protein